VARFCRVHQISRSWFYELLARSKRDGPLGATVPRSRAPRSSPTLTPPVIEDLALLVRKQLAEDGWDAGPISVRHEMLRRGMPAPSRATLARIFARRGAVVPAPAKRPRSSFRSFTYAAPNECWQLDGTDWQLADGTVVCILQVEDDHSRRILASRAAVSENADDAWAVLSTAIDRVGVPQRFLSDNGTALNQSRRGRSTLVERRLRALGVACISSSVGHPQTMGKNERSHQTVQQWLRARPPAATLVELQGLLDQYDQAYNTQRPHQSLGMLTPMQAWLATPVAPPPRPDRPVDPARAVLHHKVRANGAVSALGVSIILGAEHAGRHVLITVDDDTVEIYDHLGTHLRTVTLEPGRRSYPTGRTRGEHSHAKYRNKP
jgi:transposase InsO family protein